MTKRWLSLVVVLTLLSTLFTGVAFALASTAPSITAEPATTDPNGAYRVTITSGNTLGAGQTEKIYYSIGTTSPTAAPTTATGTLYEGAFLVSKAGTYYVQATAYLYEGSEVAYKSSEVKSFTVAGTATTVKINERAVVLTGSGSATFTATVTPASKAADVVWSVDATNLVGATTGEYGYKGEEQADGSYKVTVNGRVGSFRVTATVDGKTDTVTALVNKQDVTTFALPSSITVAAGETVEIQGTPTPANATYVGLGATSSDSGIASISSSTVDYATGVNTFIVTGVAKGTTTIAFKSFNYDASSPYFTDGITRNVTVTVTEPTNTAPKPSFDAADGKVFTEKDAKVAIKGNYDAKKNYLKTQYSTNQGGTWENYTNAIDVPNNGSITIWAKNVPVTTTSGNPYESDSEIVKATFTSEIAVTGIKLWSKADSTWSGSAINDTTVNLNGAGAIDVYAKVEPENGQSLKTGKYASYAKDPSLTFTSSNTAVAKVEYKKGDTSKQVATVTGVSKGEATITATSVNGKTASFKVTVGDVTPNTIEVNPASVTVAVGNYETVTAKVVDGTGALAFDQTVTWTVVTGTDVASVADGKIVGLKEGTATIQVNSTKYPTLAAVTINVTVTAKPAAVATPEISGKFVDGTAVSDWSTLSKDVTVTIATATDGATIYYTLDGTDPATSSTRIAYAEGGFQLTGNPANGKIRVIAVKDGQNNSAEATKDFTFSIAPTKVTLPATATVAKYATLQLTATVTPENATNKTIVWSLNNTDLATIDVVTGLLTAKKAGVVIVTATVKDTDVKASCTVTITGDEVASVVIIPSELTMNVLDQQQLQFRATLASKTTVGGTWTSSDPTVATVGATIGLVTAKKAGEATITLTYEGQTATAKVTVNADPVDIPVAPAAPTYKETTKTFTGLGKSALTAVVGNLTPASGNTLEQLFYYYNVKVTATGMPAAAADEITFVVGKDGAITMNIANLPNESFFFNYTVELEAKTDRTTTPLTVVNGTVTNNVVTITAIPTTINFTAATVADTSLEGGKTATLDFGTIANYADFTATGVAVTATANVSGEGITATAAIDGNGKVTATVEGLVKGEYTVTVTLSASGCTSVTTAAAKVTVTSDKPVVPTEKAIVVAKGTAYKGIKGVTQLAKAEQYVTFDVTGLTEGQTVTWKSSKPAYVSIDEHGVATLKKAGKATITATISDGSKLTLSVNVNKGSFADSANITLQTKVNNKWTDVTAEGITVVPKKSGQKSVPSRLDSTDDGKIVIQKVEFSDGTIASRAGDNPSPIKVKKTSISDGKTTTLTITANGAQFSVVIKVDSGAKDVYLEDIIAEIEEIVEIEEVEEIEAE